MVTEAGTITERSEAIDRLAEKVRDYAAIASGGVGASVHGVPISVFEDNPALTEVTVHNQGGIYLAGKIKIADRFTVTLFSVEIGGE